MIDLVMVDWAQLTRDVILAPVWFAIGVLCGYATRGRRAGH